MARSLPRPRALRRARSAAVGYLMVAPATVVIGVFSLVPVGWVAVLSLYSGGMVGDLQFAGLANYPVALRDPLFLQTVRNTVLYAALAVPSAIALAMAVAIAIHRLPFLQGLFRGTVYFPSIVTGVVGANVWAYVVNRDFGPLNYVLGALHLPRPDWLGDPHLAIPAIVMFEVWRGFGYYVLVFAAALTAIPHDFYEAARLDGARELRIVASITIPLLRSATGYAVVVATIWNLQLFDAVYILTRGGPGGATSTVSWYVYEQAFSADNVGLACTMSILLLAVIAVLAAAQLRFFRESLEY